MSFLESADPGSGTITDYVVTPYVGAVAQTPTTVAVGSLGSITGSDGNTYAKADVAGLTNSTAYTFTVKARILRGRWPGVDGVRENTPLAGLVFGDDFNGPAGGVIDPEWWVYDRCGYLNQSEIQYYKPDHCVLDGSGNLQLTAEHVTGSGPRYPSDPVVSGHDQPAVDERARASPTRSCSRRGAGNTMTFEARFQVNAGAGVG